MKNMLKLMFITEIINKLALKIHRTDNPTLGIAVFFKKWQDGRN
jgi:hypothetical protein